jgi:hypothetical protein
VEGGQGIGGPSFVGVEATRGGRVALQYSRRDFGHYVLWRWICCNFRQHLTNILGQDERTMYGRLNEKRSLPMSQPTNGAKQGFGGPFEG